jgi:putative flippase GtrA
MVGVTSTLIDISILYIGVSILSIHLLTSATYSFSIASINGYILNRKFTFKEEGSVNLLQYIQFLIISLIGLGLTLLFLYIFTTFLSIHYIVAKIITVVLVVFWNYFANNAWTFKSN